MREVPKIKRRAVRHADRAASRNHVAECDDHDFTQRTQKSKEVPFKLTSRTRIYGGVYYRILVWLMVIAVAGLLLDSCVKAEPRGQVVSEIYIVQQGDTLWTVAEKFIVKSSVKRDIREFVSGIEETNYELLKDRQRGVIREGDRLTVTYWVAE